MLLRLFTAAVLSAAGALAAAAAFAPAPAEAAGACVRLMRSGGQEVLVNTCGACRKVLVTRERRGVLGPPDLRSFTVFEGARHTLPFKGPGRTRLGVEEPCAGPSHQQMDPDDLVRNASETFQCVRALNIRGRGVMLTNTCAGCRAVVVERTKSGRPPKREAVTLPGRSMTPLRAAGYTGGRLLREGGCR